jgi:hypothetical protein
MITLVRAAIHAAGVISEASWIFESRRPLRTLDAPLARVVETLD